MDTDTDTYRDMDRSSDIDEIAQLAVRSDFLQELGYIPGIYLCYGLVDDTNDHEDERIWTGSWEDTQVWTLTRTGTWTWNGQGHGHGHGQGHGKIHKYGHLRIPDSSIGSKIRFSPRIRICSRDLSMLWIS
jgi:hypothetical protein